MYLVGAKSLGAYGGYETFVYKLTEYHQNKENIKYHVACKANGNGCMDERKLEGVTKINGHEFEFHNAHCFKIDVSQIGSAQAIYYDVAALKACCEHIRKNHILHSIVYIMACCSGSFASHFYKEIYKPGGMVYLNPDGECEIIWTTREKLNSCRFTRLDLFISTCFCLSWCVTASVFSGSNGFWLRSMLNPPQRKS